MGDFVKRLGIKNSLVGKGMPVVVFKGIEGWCDRLQVLAHCFAYCRKFNTALCVDWDDAIWCGMREFETQVLAGWEKKDQDHQEGAGLSDDSCE